MSADLPPSVCPSNLCASGPVEGLLSLWKYVPTFLNRPEKLTPISRHRRLVWRHSTPKERSDLESNTRQHLHIPVARIGPSLIRLEGFISPETLIHRVVVLLTGLVSKNISGIGEQVATPERVLARIFTPGVVLG